MFMSEQTPCAPVTPTVENSEVWNPFPSLSEVRGGISVAKDGSMSWRFAAPETTIMNRRHYFAERKLRIENAVAADQVHGKNIKYVNMSDRGRGALDPDFRIPETDGLITNKPDLILTTLHADCAPVFFADPTQPVIGLAHAGWRGILAGLPGLMSLRMQCDFRCKPESLRVAIGPMICQDHFEVSADLAKQFVEKFCDQIVNIKTNRYYLNLYQAICIDLQRNGIQPEQLPVQPPCTFESPDYFSYRRMGEGCPSMMAWLTLASED